MDISFTLQNILTANTPFFVYVETYFDDCFFDFITPIFAGPYLEKLKSTDCWCEEGYDKLTDEDLADFRDGKKSNMTEQTIRYFDKIS